MSDTGQGDGRRAASTTVLLVNLGTPEAPTPAAVRRYLAEFLSDRRVIDTPRWLWWPILHGVVLRVRPRRSARAYASIWTEQGSPLRVYSESLAGRLDADLRAATGGRIGAALAMRYGAPAIGATIARLAAEGVRRLLVLPLYPQYSGTSTGSVADAVDCALRRCERAPDRRFVDGYHDVPSYIEALAASVGQYRRAHGAAPRLLLSFHGIPQRYVRNGDPYHGQCLTTAQRLRERLGPGENEVTVAFQSRVGREAWLAPYTDDVLRRLPSEGVRHVQVLCPGFAVDCLETLEEVALRYRELFIASGGQRLDYIPALNDSPAHVGVLAELVRRHAPDWFDVEGAGRRGAGA